MIRNRNPSKLNFAFLSIEVKFNLLLRGNTQFSGSLALRYLRISVANKLLDFLKDSKSEGLNGA